MLVQRIGYGSEEDVIQNLKDAGCGQETIACFMRCMEQDDRKGQLRSLEEHRRCILDRVHEGERQIGCLDYLVYQISRERGDKEGVV